MFLYLGLYLLIFIIIFVLLPLNVLNTLIYSAIVFLPIRHIIEINFGDKNYLDEEKIKKVEVRARGASLPQLRRGMQVPWELMRRCTLAPGERGVRV